jgi:predicted ATP-grasp superfamily ATP-dependent carboligase
LLFFASLLKDKIDALVPVADIESMRIARNKIEMHDRARKVGFNVPRIIDTPDCFPVVLRPVSGRGNLKFVNNKGEFEEAKNFLFRKIPFFVTEYIDGEENYSFAGLFWEGKLKVFFMYREIREYPLTGGSATYAVSTYDAEIKNRCQKLLEDLKWHGVVMKFTEY